MLLACLLAVPCVALAARVPDPLQPGVLLSVNKPPSFPDAYEMEYTFSMPYFMLLQPGGLSYKVHVWVDKAQESVRIDFRGGTDTTYFIKDKEYSITPHKHDLVCKAYGHSGGGPIRHDSDRQGLGMPTGMLGKQVLPDMKGWADFGPAMINGKSARMWQRKAMAGQKVNTYTFYISEDGAPLKFHSVGQDYFAGSHYDEYLYEWTMYKPGPVDASVFKLPNLCDKQQDGKPAGPAAAHHAQGGEAGRHHHALRSIALLPGNHQEHKDEAHYQLHCHMHGRAHNSTRDYQQRLSTFASTKARILAHNMEVCASSRAPARASPAAAPAHTLKLNQFADWSREEFDRVMLPNKWRREHGHKEEKVRPPPLRTFTASLRRHQLPRELDWRATPADFAVKDQGQCGSCWAFAAVGTMEGSWYMATGTPRSFSEQQLIDCAWDQGTRGCDGGDAQPGFKYVKKAGGIAATQDYVYVGQNDFCRDDTTHLSGHFDGYVEVKSKDELAVMEALLKHGPLAVGVDASFDDFLFYSEGVYRDSRCSLKPANLDHAVILVGYGEDKEQGRYWIVKNSWSKLWGNDGYIRIKRGGNDCGIASDAAFAAVSPQYVVPGAAEKARALVLNTASA